MSIINISVEYRKTSTIYYFSKLTDKKPLNYNIPNKKLYYPIKIKG